jgi:glycosyltransferase involved in cell wall biosynthesis
MPSTPTVMHVRSTGALLGAERVILELARAAAGFGYRTLVVGLQDAGDPPPELCRAAQESGVESHTLECRSGFDTGLTTRLRGFARYHGISLIHTHGYKEDIHVLAARAGVPKVATNHLWKRTTWRLRLYARLDARALRRFDHVVAVSRPILDEMRHMGLDPARMSLIPNGIDASAFASPLTETRRQAVRAAFAFSLDDVVAISVSSLTVEKGHRFMLAAMPEIVRACPHVRYLVVGAGPAEVELRREANHLGVSDRVSFAGPRSDVADLLRAADVFVLPSLIEGLPMALLEAMAAGLPAVASAVGDVPAVLRDGYNGTLHEPGSVRALTDAVTRYAADPERRLAHAREARATVLERFSSTGMAKAYYALYDRLLSHRTGA